MERAAAHTNVIVPEVLRRDNYDRWSILMRYYLLGQGLWDVVQPGELDIVQPDELPAEGNMRKEWMKKNALALHAIMISCGEEIFDQIKEKDSAKKVWDALADMQEQEIVERPPERQRTGLGNFANWQYEYLTNAIFNGDLERLQFFFTEILNPGSARIFENGYTALHFAVYNGKSKIVDYLIKCQLSETGLETKDDSGSTALSIAARYGVRKSIAQSLVRKNDKLLTIPDNHGKIPVELACSTIREDLTRYLYRKTPLRHLKGYRGLYILHECITRKMFDIAFDLLHHFPRLAYQGCVSGLIVTLAQTSPPFFHRRNLPFWGRWIYNCIIVKAHVIKEGQRRSCVEKVRDFFQPFTEVIQQRLKSCREQIQQMKQDFRDRMQQPIQGIGQMNQEANEGLAIGIMLSVPLILGKLILVALRLLVSILSRILAKNVYAGKLMDKYACEVISLLCQQLSELDQELFVGSRAVDAIFQAIKNDIPVIVKEMAKANKNILWRSSKLEDSINIFACTVAHRQEEVARLLYEFAKEDTNMFTTIDKDGNNILHLAAKLAPPYQLGCISGSALQLQSELRWFKGVEDIVPRSVCEHKNNNRETALEVFLGEHKDLLKEAEEWVKKTAESSTVVGALIITIMFAVAFTVPGGQDQSTGFPVSLHKTPVPFMVFMVSDAISLFAASSSVLMFLGILTSRFAYKDFHKSLPIRLVVGLSSLFISIATMTMAFCAALVIMLEGRLEVVIPITLLAGIPVTCFVVLQFPLLVEIYVSTFSPNIFARKVSSWT
ncbi:hypothetical protein SLE2022_080050 [Rubroshorea leprosula]